MKVSRIGNDKVTVFGPYIKGPYKYETTVYEQGGRRLTVDSFYKNGQLTAQNKSYFVDGNKIKEIVVRFTDGIRDKIERIKEYNANL